MRRVFYVSTLFLLLGILTSCSDNSKRLDATQLAELFASDTRAKFTTLRFEGSVRFNADYSAHLIVPALGEDDGKWYLNDDQICVKWNKALKKAEVCAYLHLKENGTFSVRNPATNVSLGSFTILN